MKTYLLLGLMLLSSVAVFADVTVCGGMPCVVVVACPGGTSWNAVTALCEPILPSTCDGSTVGDSCTGPPALTDAPADAWHCGNTNSAGVEQTPAVPGDGFCCVAGDFWDPSSPLANKCRTSNPCSDPGICTQALPSFPSPAPVTPAYNTRGGSHNALCVGPTANQWTSGWGACCNVGTKFGQTNYFDYQDASGSAANNYVLY